MLAHHLLIGEEEVTKLTIPDEVTSIKPFAFAGCNALTSVTIPLSVKSIGTDAFRDCTALTKAEFPDVASLCSIAFGSLSANPLYNAHHLYVDGSELTEVVIPTSALNGSAVNSYVLAGASYLTSVQIPAAADSIGDNAFEGCEVLVTAEFSSIDQVTSMKYGTDKSNPLFYAKNLKIDGKVIDEITVSNDTVRKNTFAKSKWLKKVTFEEGVTTIEESAFAGCSLLTSVSFSSTIREIGNSAFRDCNNLLSIDLPISLQAIGDQGFRGCQVLTEIVIPDGCQLGREAFMYCTKLESAKLPAGLNMIPTGLTEEKLDLELYRHQQEWEFDTVKQKQDIDERIKKDATSDPGFEQL